MEALVFRRQIGRYLFSRAIHATMRRAWSPRLAPLHRMQLEWPVPREAGWLRVDVRQSGICGTDLRLVNGRDSLYLEPEATYPFVPGHELVGEIAADCSVEPEHTEAGSGRRVAVWPILGCRVRTNGDWCPSCVSGWEGVCERRDERWPGAGCSIGFNHATGGGWSEACLAHRSQLWSLPDHVSDDDAVLLDPAAAALAALLRGPEEFPQATLVIGGGAIAFLVALLHRALGLPGDCALLVRHGFQQEWARARALTAWAVDREEEFHAWASARGMPARRVLGYGWVYRGIYDRVIDCAGTRASLRRAIQAVRPRGEVVLISAPADLRGDATPLWYREIACRGVNQYGPVRWDGEWRHPYEVLLPFLVRGSIELRGLITHRFTLREHIAALEAVTARTASRAIKVVLTPSARTHRDDRRAPVTPREAPPAAPRGA